MNTMKDALVEIDHVINRFKYKFDPKVRPIRSGLFECVGKPGRPDERLFWKIYNGRLQLVTATNGDDVEQVSGRFVSIDLRGCQSALQQVLDEYNELTSVTRGFISFCRGLKR